MEEQSYLESSSREIAAQLPVIRKSQFARRFHLDDNLVVHEQVQALQGNDLIKELDRNQNLSFHLMPELPQNPHECLDVNLLEESIPKLVVHEVKRADDGLGDLRMKKIDLSFRVFHPARSA